MRILVVVFILISSSFIDTVGQVMPYQTELIYSITPHAKNSNKYIITSMKIYLFNEKNKM